MIARILTEGWHNRGYIEQYVNGFDGICPWFEGFDARAALKVCELDYEQVRDVCHLVATRKTSLHPDLGVYMSRHSTATSCLRIREIICKPRAF